MLRSLRSALALMCACVVFTNCAGRKVTTTPNVTNDRSRKLSVLAATEAGFIKDPDARLTRQLNIADQVQQRYSPEDALAVLEQATKTLHDVGPGLEGFTRISGWVSVSQLARKSTGVTVAEDAAKEAQKELEALPDPGERCQYVISVAEEIGQAEGDAAAINVLTLGGEWAKGITASSDRRAARLAFAIALFNLNAYEGGVASLRGEEDAAWSSDTMLAIASRDADNARQEAYARGNEEQAVRLFKSVVASPAPPAMQDQVGSKLGGAGINGLSGNYGRSLGYQVVFQGQSNSKR